MGGTSSPPLSPAAGRSHCSSPHGHADSCEGNKGSRRGHWQLLPHRILGTAGASPPWAQRKTFHLGWVCAAGHQPGLEAGGDTEDRQLLLVVTPQPLRDVLELPPPWAVPCPPSTDPAVSSTWVWGLVNSDSLYPCPCRAQSHLGVRFA